MAKMTLGPVIGKVTDTTARILLEADGAAQVTCTLTAAGLPPVQQAQAFRQNRPGVFRFAALQPATSYAVTFQGLTQPRAGRVRTYPTNCMALNVGVVSCNNTPRRGDTELWQDLFDRYIQPGDVQLLLHAGDQVYGDRSFEGAIRILQNKPKPTKTQEAEILELYRRLYRWAWNHPPTQLALAHVPNLMIWDDHEIRDDWGSRDDDGKKGTPDYIVGNLARRVYREYQRQLWDDFNTDADAPADQVEDHVPHHTWGSIGVLFVDQRGARSFNRDPSRPYLGTPQWDRITQSLTTGALSQVRVLIVVTSVPLTYIGTFGSTVGSAIVNDLKDHWAFGPHQKEQIEMLRALRIWKQRTQDRELLVVGGDVHLGGLTEIRHENQAIFRQLIASGITNTAPALLGFAAIPLLEQEWKLNESYSFVHSNFTHRRNFGVVVVRVPPLGQLPHVAGSLFISPK